MTNGWTPERRAWYAVLIRQRRPWEQSTGPKSAEGKARVARNAWRGGTRGSCASWPGYCACCERPAKSDGG